MWFSFSLLLFLAAARSAQLGERQFAEREVGSLNPCRTNTQGLKMRRKCCERAHVNFTRINIYGFAATLKLTRTLNLAELLPYKQQNTPQD